MRAAPALSIYLPAWGGHPLCVRSDGYSTPRRRHSPTQKRRVYRVDELCSVLSSYRADDYVITEIAPAEEESKVRHVC